MPTLTLERVENRKKSAEQRLAKLGEGADPVRRRALKKSARRAGRKIRRLKVAAERRAGKPAGAASE